MKKGFVFLLLFLFPAEGYGQYLNVYHEYSIYPRVEALAQETASARYLRSNRLLPEGIPRQPVQDTEHGKSPVKAALFSLLIPGAGQWYAGSKWKALAFVSADIALLLSIGHFNDEGDRIETEFQAYADTHWDKAEYLAWLQGLPPTERERLSHHLPDTKTQQYYEMIGKYDQFLAGWPDSDGFPAQSSMSLYYMARQDASNDQYKRAELLANMMLLNRVISAVEAVISIKRHNSRFQPGLTMEPAPTGSSLMPVVRLTYKR
ncbi:DUF5683 domain-containing protein [candidate division KSB1 bacterium]